MSEEDIRVKAATELRLRTMEFSQVFDDFREMSLKVEQAQAKLREAERAYSKYALWKPMARISEQPLAEER